MAELRPQSGQFHTDFHGGHGRLPRPTAFNTNLTFVSQNEGSGYAWHVQLADFPGKTTIQVGMGRRLGKVRQKSD